MLYDLTLGKTVAIHHKLDSIAKGILRVKAFSTGQCIVPTDWIPLRFKRRGKLIQVIDNQCRVRFALRGERFFDTDVANIKQEFCPETEVEEVTGRVLSTYSIEVLMEPAIIWIIRRC